MKTPFTLVWSIERRRSVSGPAVLQDRSVWYGGRCKLKTGFSLDNKPLFEVFYIVKAFCPRRSQYKCQSRRKQDTKSHHNNWDVIISGNLEHRETPKIADRPVWSPKWPKMDSPLQGKKSSLASEARCQRQDCSKSLRLNIFGNRKLLTVDENNILRNLICVLYCALAERACRNEDTFGCCVAY